MDSHSNNFILSDAETKRLHSFVTERNDKPVLELEASIKINLEQYSRCLEYFALLVPEDKISGQDTLDIRFQNGKEVYRITVIGQEQVNEFYREHSVLSTSEFSQKVLRMKPSDSVQIDYKSRNHHMISLREYMDTNIKISIETPVNDIRDLGSKFNPSGVHFRSKKRFSFQLDNTRIDITEVLSCNQNLRCLQDQEPSFELEIEVTGKTITSRQFLDDIWLCLSFIQDSDTVITSSEIEKITKELSHKIVTNRAGFQVRNVVSVKEQVMPQIVTNTAVTDKADGERVLLYVSGNDVYLSSPNRTIRKTLLKVPNGLSGLVLDGELITIKKIGALPRKLYLSFDIMKSPAIDFQYNADYALRDRLDIATEFISEIGHKIPFHSYVDQHSDMDLAKIAKFYQQELRNYWQEFHKLWNSTKGMLILPKVHIFSLGIDPSEIFLYWKILYQNNTSKGQAPYLLDGIIISPTNTPYLKGSNTKALDEFKWKPPEMNTIDFYVKWVKDERGNVMTFSLTGDSESRYYLADLYLGSSQGGSEVPVPFKPKGVAQQAALFLQGEAGEEGVPFDEEGNILYDETVVEFRYDSSNSKGEQSQRWIPLRTRWDKTASVRRDNRKYGNHIKVGMDIWKTIENPITMDHISSLANPTTYQNQMKIYEKSVTAVDSTITYYQKRNADAVYMRAFNNWIKANMIQNYSHNLDLVLDIGCGRGGDLDKFNRAGVKMYVGTDIDAHGLFTLKNDSAICRYQKMAKRTQMKASFVQADARVPFDSESQMKSIPTMKPNNAQNVDKLLRKQYQLVNMQFTIHYYLSGEEDWDNFCQNLAMTTDDGAYVLITCFDGDLIYREMEKKNKIKADYVDSNGVTTNLFEIRKVYSKKAVPGVGLGIDLHNSLISEPGRFNREYLVFSDHLQKSLKQKCGLEMVETDTFYNMFQKHRNYFTSDISCAPANKMIQNVRKFYKLLESDDSESSSVVASFKMASLNRYYVFRKTSFSSQDNATQISQKRLSSIIAINNPLVAAILDHHRIRLMPESASVTANDLWQKIKDKVDTNAAIYTLRQNDGDKWVVVRSKGAKKQSGGAKHIPTVLLYRDGPGKYYSLIQSKYDFDGNHVDDLHLSNHRLAFTICEHMNRNVSNY